MFEHDDAPETPAGHDAFDVEVTDTFGGEANYSWCNRYIIHVPKSASERMIMRRAKAAAGLTGITGRKESYGDTTVFYPFHSCTVMFVTYREER